MRRATSVQEFARLFAGGKRIRTFGPSCGLAPGINEAFKRVERIFEKYPIEQG
jgi:hypothetical protein